MIAETSLIVRIVGVTCGMCNIPFGLEVDHLASLKRTGRSFYCPNGHSISYTESENKRLQRQLEEEHKKLQQSNDNTKWYASRLTEEQTSHRKTVHRLNATRGVVTRYKRRAVQGRCVCCSKQFKDLERHMKNLHPHFDAEKHIAALEAKA